MKRIDKLEKLGILFLFIILVVLMFVVPNMNTDINTGKLIINEVMLINNNTIMDKYGKYSDYIDAQRRKVSTFNKLIVTWFDRNEYTKIKNTYSYHVLSFVLYDFEEAWRRGYRKEVDKYLDHKHVIDSMTKIGLKNQLAHEVPFDYRDDNSSLINTESTLDYYEALREIYNNNGRSAENSNEYVQACTIISDNYRINYTPNHKVVEVSNLISGFGFSRNMQAHELEHGDCILVRSSDKDIIASVADKLIGTKANSLREQSQLWIKCLQMIIEDKGYDIACELMCKDDLCTKQQVRYWSMGEIICPDNPNVLKRIAELVSGYDSADAKRFRNEVDKTYTAGKTLRNYHIKAGSTISNELKGRSSEIKELFRTGREGQLTGVGKVMILEVDVVFADQYVYRNTINRLEKL